MNARFAPIVPSCADPRPPEVALSPLHATLTGFDAALCKLGPQGGLRLQDFTESVQRAVTPEDIDEAFGVEWEHFEDRIAHGPELSPQEKLQFDVLERIYVLACLRVEGRGANA